MLIIIHTASFDKRFKVLSGKLKKRAFDRLRIFAMSEYDESLSNHRLHGEYSGCRSINISGDLRLVYRKIDESTVLLIDIGTHNQLYE